MVDLQSLIAVFPQQKPAPQAAPSPTPPPHIVYNPTQHMLTYAGFCPSGQALPAYPNYPIPIQVGTKNTHLYTTALHDKRVDYGLMMSSDSTVKCKSENNSDTEDCLQTLSLFASRSTTGAISLLRPLSLFLKRDLRPTPARPRRTRASSLLRPPPSRSLMEAARKQAVTC